jgi:hypothetical protein
MVGPRKDSVMRDASLRLARQDRDCHPERSEGGLGAYTPREDITMRRPEGSGGCLAIARYDKTDARQDKKRCSAG